MKYFKILITLCGLFIVTTITAQKIEYQGKEYLVKKDNIFYNDEDVTHNLTELEQNAIKNNLKIEIDKEAEIEKKEKTQKKAEKDLKKAEKELKKRQKTQNNLYKNQDKYNKDLRKYEKLKYKGKLSPENEAKWLKKLAKEKEKLEDSKKKLRKL